MKTLLFVLLAATKTYPVEVLDCYDGDTCTVHVIMETHTQEIGMNVEVVTLVRAKNIKLRLCDIDTPEIRSPDKEAAILARDMLKKWIQQSDSISIAVPQKNRCTSSCDKFDKYGRLLAYVIADRENLNYKLADNGLAKLYKDTCE